jgi:arylformamidase
MLEVEALSAGYGSIQVLHRISLRVEAGQSVCLIGANGAGKTTLLRCLAGLLRPSAGRIRIEGTDIAAAGASRRLDFGVTLVPEGRRIFSPMSVRENIEMGAFRRLWPRRDRAVVADMDMVFDLFPRLRERQKQTAGLLSGGEQQMLAIGRALMSRPRLLLLDEPSMGLAPRLVQEIFATIGGSTRREWPFCWPSRTPIWPCKTRPGATSSRRARSFAAPRAARWSAVRTCRLSRALMTQSGSETLQTIDTALEAQYALRQRHPEREEVYDDHQRRSAAVRAAGNCRLDVRYGEGPRCLLDIFPAGDRAPVLFFVHGGYWRALDKSYVSFIAEPFRRAGISVVMPGYDLVPAVRVGGIVDQIRAALAWVVEQMAPKRIVVAGHSAGGQLAAMLALDQAARGEGPIVGLMGVSGAFDLRPLLQTSINRDLMMSADEAVEASPLLRLARLPAGATLAPLLGVVGADETKGFKRWTADLVAGWRSHGGAASYCEMIGCNHFTILDRMAEADGEILRAILGFVA